VHDQHTRQVRWFAKCCWLQHGVTPALCVLSCNIKKWKEEVQNALCTTNTPGTSCHDSSDNTCKPSNQWHTEQQEQQHL
jgi:hypothetical protein